MGLRRPLGSGDDGHCHGTQTRDQHVDRQYDDWMAATALGRRASQTSPLGAPLPTRGLLRPLPLAAEPPPPNRTRRRLPRGPSRERAGGAGAGLPGQVLMVREGQGRRRHALRVRARSRHRSSLAWSRSRLPPHAAWCAAVQRASSPAPSLTLPGPSCRASTRGFVSHVLSLSYNWKTAESLGGSRRPPRSTGQGPTVYDCSAVPLGYSQAVQLPGCHSGAYP